MVSLTPGWAQAGFTAVLVIITAVYAYQTHRHVELVENQMQRESRRHHTEILRGKVAKWLENLPTVVGARAESSLEFQSAGHPYFDENRTFWTIPIALDGDPFFQDFLDNHATQCADLKDGIESHYSEYQDLRREFVEKYDDPDHIEELPFESQILRKFPLWAFENGVLLSRGILTLEEVKEDLVNAIENDNMAQRPPMKRYACSLYGWGDPYIVEAAVFEEDSYGDHRVIEDREEQVIKALHDTLDELPGQQEFELIEAVAEHLSQVDEDIRKLDLKLTEYKGMEIFAGDCDYIAE